MATSKHTGKPQHEGEADFARRATQNAFEQTAKVVASSSSSLQQIANIYVMQICALEVKEPAGGTRQLVGTVSDGETTMRARLNSKYLSTFDRQELSSNDIIKITNGNSVNDGRILSVLDLEVVGKYSGPCLLQPTETPRKKAASASAVRPYKGSLTPKSDAPVSPSECAINPRVCSGMQHSMLVLL